MILYKTQRIMLIFLPYLIMEYHINQLKNKVMQKGKKNEMKDPIQRFLLRPFINLFI